MSKVLVVDDSLSVRKVVERALAGRQIEVVCAASGSEAIELLERDAPDVVVCDVVMPDRDGYEICEFIKRHPRLSHTPVWLMSGLVNEEVRERAARVPPPRPAPPAPRPAPCRGAAARAPGAPAGGPLGGGSRTFGPARVDKRVA